MVPLQRSDSMESTVSEREFRKKYQAITHRMVHRKSSAVMYSRILERTFGKMRFPNYSAASRVTAKISHINLTFSITMHFCRSKHYITVIARLAPKGLTKYL